MTHDQLKIRELERRLSTARQQTLRLTEKYSDETKALRHELFDLKRKLDHQTRQINTLTVEREAYASQAIALRKHHGVNPTEKAILATAAARVDAEAAAYRAASRPDIANALQSAAEVIRHAPIGDGPCPSTSAIEHNQ